MTSQQMFNEIKAYVEHIAFAQNCLVAYCDLLNQAEINLDLIDLSPGFFKTTQYALSKYMMIEFSKLFCGSGNEKTIYKLKKNVMANANLFDKDIKIVCKEFDMEYERCVPIIKRLRERRDHDLVHNDPKFFLGTTNPALDNYISVEDFKTLYNLCLCFCLKLFELLIYDEKTTVIHPIVDNDLDKLMKTARNGCKHSQNVVKRIIKHLKYRKQKNNYS